jgi:hypothetical protein
LKLETWGKAGLNIQYPTPNIQYPSGEPGGGRAISNDATAKLLLGVVAREDSIAVDRRLKAEKMIALR